MSTLDLSTNPYDGSALGNLSDGLGVIEPLAPADLRNAALTVAECARDAGDAGLLLAMLGLGEGA